MSVRIAFAGVAHSHPFSDAARLRERSATVVGVWDADDSERANDFARQFDVSRVNTLSELLEGEPDLVVATPRTPRTLDVLGTCTARGIRCFANKTLASTEEHLSTLEAFSPEVVCSASVLRFSPTLAEFSSSLGADEIFAVDVMAQHDIDGFLTGSRRWQDERRSGGGTGVNIGIHAWEMIDVLLPGADVAVTSAGASSAGLATASEGVATIHARTDSTLVTATISGMPGPDRYAARVVTSSGVYSCTIADTPESLGFDALADELIRFAGGARWPVDGNRTRQVYVNAVRAARAFRDGGES